MNSNDEPNLVQSGKSQVVAVDGYRFEIEIYRLETEPEWHLEVVDYEGNSFVFDDRFKTDTDALNTALQALEEEGARGFMNGGDNVVPFKRG